MAQLQGCCGSPVEKAIEYARQGAQLDPLNPWAVTNVAIAYWHAHRYEDALREIDLVFELDPPFWVAHKLRTVVLDDLGRFDEALGGRSGHDGAQRQQPHPHGPRHRSTQELATWSRRSRSTTSCRTPRRENTGRRQKRRWCWSRLTIARGRFRLSSVPTASGDRLLLDAVHAKRLAPLIGEPRFDVSQSTYRKFAHRLGEVPRVEFGCGVR